MRFRPALGAVAALTLLNACSSLPSWLPLAAWAPLSGSCPAGSASPVMTNVVGGQLRAPISLLDPSTRDAREVPVPKGDVGLADLTGASLPGVHATTDANGQYTLRRVLDGYAYEVTARVKTSAGRTITLRALTEGSSGGATTDINIATTILTIALTNGLTGMPGTYDQDQYKRAVALVYQHLVVEGSPDPSDAATIVSRVTAWGNVDAELKGLVAALRQELGANQPPLADVIGRIDGINGQPAASGAATPASPTPSPTGSTSASTAPGDVTPSSAYPPGFNDGALAAAQFNGLSGIAADGKGNIYAADATNHRVRKLVLSTSQVSTVAGTGTSGDADGSGTGTAQFVAPRDVAVDDHDQVYVADYLDARIRVINMGSPQQDVTTLAGSLEGNRDGDGTGARFDHPAALALDAGFARLYVAESGGSTIRAIDLRDVSHAVRAIAGSYQQAGDADGAPGDARFNAPQGLVVGPDHSLYVADTGNELIRRITFDQDGEPQRVETIAGRSAAGSTGAFADGNAPDALFSEPIGLAYTPDNSLLVADALNHRIRRVHLDASPMTVDTLAGPDLTDSTGRPVTLAFPAHVTVDGTKPYLSDLRLGLLLPTP